jgi:hypothetical protein
MALLGNDEKVGIGADHVDHVNHFNQRVLPFASSEKVVNRFRLGFVSNPIHNG